jgi:hypothetical protein
MVPNFEIHCYVLYDNLPCILFNCLLEDCIFPYTTLFAFTNVVIIFFNNELLKICMFILKSHFFQRLQKFLLVLNIKLFIFILALLIILK